MKKSAYDKKVTNNNDYIADSGRFDESFEKELSNTYSDDTSFSESLKHIQKMALKGKLNPIHKQVMEEWQSLFPDRFENFCNQMSDQNRQKLIHFLHLDHDES